MSNKRETNGNALHIFPNISCQFEHVFEQQLIRSSETIGDFLVPNLY